MRLVDVNKLNVRELPYPYPYTSPEDMDDIVRIDDVEKIIENAPTFEFPEARILHNDEDAAEWKATRAYPHIVYCPKCFNTYVSNREWIINGYIDKAEFCPHCGQPMSDDDGYLTYTGDDEEETEDGTAQ